MAARGRRDDRGERRVQNESQAPNFQGVCDLLVVATSQPQTETEMHSYKHDDLGSSIQTLMCGKCVYV
jgi:hypothetical protein